MAQLLENDIDWFIGFVGDAGRFNFWDIITTKDFRHCYAFRFDGYNWILVDPMGSWLEVQVMPYEREDNVPHMMLERGHKVVYVMKNRKNEQVLRGLLTCVSIVKHLIGVRACWIFTPKQLYKHLLEKNYGRIIKATT